MKIHTKMHTIFLLVGPTECGKTTFAKEVLIPALQWEYPQKNYKSNVQYLSSDAIRQELLGYSYDKYDQVMLEASSHAFQLLFERLKLTTSFPIQADFVVVDTTALSDDFRSKVLQVARDNNYRVEVILFDYRKRADYYASDRSKKLISTHISRLKKEVLPVLAREGYDAIHKVRAKDFLASDGARLNPVYEVIVNNKEEYLSSILLQDEKYIIVGDVHERVDALQGLLKSYGYELVAGKLVVTDRVRNTRIILAGDWIDKGKRTREIIDFLYINREHFLLLTGNHENFVYKYMRGEIKGADPELLRSYFDSTETLGGDEMLLQRFNELVSRSKPFYRWIGQGGPSYYVTHAPCRNKYIGKLDSHSMRHQRSFRLDRQELEVTIEQQLSFLEEEAVTNHPYHIFGHIAAKKPFRIKNKIHIDTGSVHGHMLTSVVIGQRPVYRSYKSPLMDAERSILQEELPELFKRSEQNKISIEDLDHEALRRLDYCSKHKVNFISGTMSPADKDMEAGDLESLARGLDYYKEQGISEVVLEPKYMGSRCNIYLYRDIDRCYAVSRNGYQIRGVDLSAIYEQLQVKFASYMRTEGLEMMLLDGELLPWKALGEGLIRRQFQPIARALETETQFLKETGFEKAFGELLAAYDASGFEKEQFQFSKSSLIEKHGSSHYQSYKNMRAARRSYMPLSEHEKAYAMYKKQLDIYAGDAELSYKPFAILKEVLESGEERIPDMKTSEMFRFLNEDGHLALDLNATDSYKQAEDFFSKLTTEKRMEGVVIKPEKVQAHVVPYLKVRNPEYLSIIYGYDYRFPHKYAKLLKQKSIHKKLRTSITEYQLGNQMLAVKYEDITPNHEEYKSIAVQLMFEMEKEKEIDPRL
ncbi:AAA family ATPase [Paenibacillus faecalis]|uniref:AAA family ATPase n=1 Tax=Paenibacillus faecalis TaxID=2079532 RepID=UPI000D106DD9|nr:AAA family ATPase [Paenibacillus faecalis]